MVEQRVVPARAAAPRRIPPRFHFIRFIALFAAAMAVCGLGASLYGWAQIGRVETVLRDGARQTGATLTQVAISLQTASDSATHAAGSADDARTALADASKTTRDLAATLDETGKTLDVTIPGLNIRPFTGVETNFRSQSDEFRTLSTSIDATRTSIAQNATDLRAIGTNTGALAATMRDRATLLNDLARPGSTLDTIITPLRVLAAWSVLLHLLLLGMGVSLFVLTIERHAPLPADLLPDGTTPLE